MSELVVEQVISMNDFRTAILKHIKDTNNYQTERIPLDLLKSKMFEKESCKEWEGSSKNGINLYWGFVNGDLENVQPIKLDNKGSHLNIIGNTGMGKSNALNCMLQCLMSLYPPLELTLHLLDFKLVELLKYGSPPEPHVYTVSGSKDIDFVITQMNYFIASLEEREKFYSDLKLTNLSEFRDYCLTNSNIVGTKEYYKFYPRVLIVIDEIQDFFKSSDDSVQVAVKTLSSILAKGRALGMHLIVCSQGTSKTFNDEDMERFQVRGSLLTSITSSKSHLGSDIGSRILPYEICINPNIQISSVSPLVFKVPYNNTTNDQMKLIKDYNIKYDNERSKWYSGHPTVLYSGTTIRNLEDLPLIIKRIKGYSESELCLLGDNALFSLNRSPVAFKFTNEPNQNMWISGDMDNIRRILLTILISMGNKCDVIKPYINIFNGNKEFFNLYDMRSINQLYDNECSINTMQVQTYDDFINYMINLYRFRFEQSNAQSKRFKTSINILFDIDSLINAPDYYDERVQQMESILKQAGTLNIHTIIAGRNCMRQPFSKAFPAHNIVCHIDKDTAYELDSPKAYYLQDDYAIYTINKTHLLKFKIFKYTFKHLNSEELIEDDS